MFLRKLRFCIGERRKTMRNKANLSGYGKGSQKLAEVVCFTINHGFVGGTAVISKLHEISEIRIKLPLAFWNPRFSIELLVQSFREMFPFCYM